MTTVLIACAPDSPLLAEGVGGALPPCVDDYGPCPTHGDAGCPTPHCWVRWHLHRPGWGTAASALPLLWEGRICADGLDRAHRVLRLGPPGAYNETLIREFAVICVSRGLGRVVVLESGADG